MEHWKARTLPSTNYRGGTKRSTLVTETQTHTTHWLQCTAFYGVIYHDFKVCCPPPNPSCAYVNTETPYSAIWKEHMCTGCHCCSNIINQLMGTYSRTFLIGIINNTVWKAFTSRYQGIEKWLSVCFIQPTKACLFKSRFYLPAYLYWRGVLRTPPPNRSCPQWEPGYSITREWRNSQTLWKRIYNLICS